MSMRRIFPLVFVLVAACTGGGGEAQFHNDQGIEALGQDRYEDARASFEKSLEQNREDGVVWGNLGVALTRLERYDEALAAYEKSDQLEPNDPITTAEIAAIHYRLGHYAEAEAGFRKAIGLEPRAPEFRSSLSLALLHQGKTEEAEAELAKALPQAKKRGLVQYHHAAYLLLSGQSDQALDTFESALAIYPAGARASVSDPDFEPLHDNPRYQELVKDWWKGGAG